MTEDVGTAFVGAGAGAGRGAGGWVGLLCECGSSSWAARVARLGFPRGLGALVWLSASLVCGVGLAGRS